MNVSDHEKEKNEKIGKREARKERKQSTDFKEAARCLFSAVQWAARQKNGSCEGSARSNWDSRKDQHPI